ncbi:hypothetical protein [Legionella maioricensis]|uniref:Uncharacterized protein n=1 Tax=Legionella maioricensis TaxID=2896528 RepID=A0A9X2D144_9GAMM|nr:hypothetical protein [Legionella maioricensis]MCL9684564.1 hypothetical protein [Legionella maioricensis]MCL9687345.1 hypothetical protein [Legionella maioricensis]
MKQSKKVRSKKQAKIQHEELKGVSGGSPDIRVCTAKKDGIRVCTGQSPRK